MRSFTNKIHLTTGSQNPNVIIPLFIIKLCNHQFDLQSNLFYDFIQVVREIERERERERENNIVENMSRHRKKVLKINV